MQKEMRTHKSDTKSLATISKFDWSPWPRRRKLHTKSLLKKKSSKQHTFVLISGHVQHHSVLARLSPKASQSCAFPQYNHFHCTATSRCSPRPSHPSQPLASTIEASLLKCSHVLSYFCFLLTHTTFCYVYST